MPTEASPAPPPSSTSPNATPAAAPPPPAERAPSEFMGDIEADFADMDAGKPPPSRERDDRGKFKPAAAKPDETKPEETATPPPEDATKPPEGATKPTETETPKPVKAAELRTAFEGLKKRVREEFEPTIQRLKAKIQEYETKPPEDTAPILQKLKVLEDRNKHLEAQTELRDFQESERYQKEFEQPYAQRWNEAMTDLRELDVRVQSGTDPATGEPTFTTRQADESDLIRLGAMKLSDLYKNAREMFGDAAPTAVDHVKQLKRLAGAKAQAIEDAKKKAGEWKSQRSLEFQNRQKNLATAWTDINKGLQEKFPLAFNAAAGDADDATSHRKGFALADLLFLGNEALSPEQVEALPGGFKESVKDGKPLTEVQKVQLHAIARLKMANHDRKVVQLKKATARIAELEKVLAEYENSEPRGVNAGEGGRTSIKPWDEQIADELKALDK